MLLKTNAHIRHGHEELLESLVGGSDHVPRGGPYYEEIAGDLVHAEEIILIGHATGKSSAVEFLSEYLKIHHPDRQIIPRTAE
jgi:hypothetical protein